MRSIRLIVAATVSLCALTACGIRAEDSPRAIRPELLPIEDVTNDGQVAVSGSRRRVWMIAPRSLGRETELRAVGRGAASTSEELLDLLVAGLTLQERADRISTAIPTDTEVLSARSSPSGVLVVDLSGAFVDISNDLLVDAVAQIVFTAAEFEGVTRIKLLIEGEPREWPRGNGTSTADPLTPFDFPEHNPTSQPDYPAVPATPLTDPPSPPTT